MKEQEHYDVKGMTCASCQARVEKAVRHLHGVRQCDVNLMMNNMTVSYDDSLTASDIIDAVRKAGYDAALSDKSKSGRPKTGTDAVKNESRFALIRLILSILLLIPLFYISMAFMTMEEWHWPLGAFGENPFYIALTEMLLSLLIMLLNYRFFTSGLKALFHGGPNMDTLVSLGSLIAFLYSFSMMFVMAFYAKENDWSKVMQYSMNLSFETSGMVPTLISIGKTLEAFTKGKTTSAIQSLLSMAPKQATVIRDGAELLIPAEQMRVGDIYLVRPGETIPADGIVKEGTTCVDESILTGESLPVDKKDGDTVSSGTMNSNGTIWCIATKVGNETTLHQIVKMVEDASGTKTKISRIVDKVAGVFVPVVLSISFVVFLFWILLGNDFVQGSMLGVTTLSYALERAVAVLVISCPCSLGLATPVAIMAASGKGARNGILFKTASSMEACGKCDFVVLDKTGTITTGEVHVDSVIPYENEDKLLSVACSLESLSEHPLSKAVSCYGKEKGVLISSSIISFQALPGFGVEAIIDGKHCFGGNMKMMEDKGLITDVARKEAEKLSEQGKTPLFFAEETTLLGIISVFDRPKLDSKEAIEEMRREGMRVIMLTGDNARTAKKVAKDVGVDCYVSDVLPDGKLAVIRELKKYGKVLMVGDGINDAPALTLADVGVAVRQGSDIAIDSADVVLMKSSLMDALKAIRLSRHALYNIKENLFWAFFYNVIMIPVAAGAFSSVGLMKMKPWMGALMMSVSSLTVVLNALRINFFSLDKRRKERKGKELPQFLSEKKETETLFLSVPDMMCENCVKHVSEALLSVKGVLTCEVSLGKLQAKLIMEKGNDRGELLQALKKAGYQGVIIEENK